MTGHGNNTIIILLDDDNAIIIVTDGGKVLFVRRKFIFFEATVNFRVPLPPTASSYYSLSI